MSSRIDHTEQQRQTQPRKNRPISRSGANPVRTPIDRQELAAQLQKLGHRGGLAEEERIKREAPLLLTLTERLLDLDADPSIQIEPEMHPVTPHVLKLLEDALHNFSPTSGALLRAGLNLDRRSDTTKDQRISELARQRLTTTSHFLERERGLYLPLADFLLEEVAIVRSRRAHEALARGDGDQSAAALFVAKQFQYYYRVFTPMGAVGSDLIEYLIRRNREPDMPPTNEILDDAIWYYAQWQLAVTRFIADLGGNWIASTPDAEADIVERLADAERLLPFGDWDASLLRLALLKAAHGERVTFERHLQQDKLRLRFRRRLRTWVERCDCNLRRPKLKTCEPHQAITAMEQFTILIDREWYRLATWYHLPPETVSAERNNVKHYFLHADPENYDLARLDRAAQGGQARVKRG
jgi:hypothetical protein